jgi:ectoine hydroxylase-related dioxygenase (phytanoyl-CoA dioxygenase family)
MAADVQASHAPLERDVTDAEVNFFKENGWVFLPQLVDREACAQILAHARERMGETGEEISDPTRARRPRGAAARSAAEFADYYHPAGDFGVCEQLTYSPKVGGNVQRLMSRDVGVRYHYDLIGCKIPESREGGTGATFWHQDDPSSPFDRDGAVVVWLALTDLTPDTGTMRFLNGSRREGRLGRLNLNQEGADMFELYPDLASHEISEPLTYAAGDATAHHGLTLHFAPSNTSSQPRWAYIRAYFAADARYTGSPWFHMDGLGLQVDQLIENPKFPLVHEGAAPRSPAADGQTRIGTAVRSY